jgi:hypothetical protein
MCTFDLCSHFGAQLKFVIPLQCTLNILLLYTIVYFNTYIYDQGIIH